MKTLNLLLFCLIIIPVSGNSQVIVKNSFSSFSSTQPNANLIINSGQPLMGQTNINLTINHGYLPLNRFFLSIEPLIFSDYNLFPNPTNHLISLNSDKSRSGELSIYAITGELIFTKNFTTNSNQLDISFLSNGIYYVSFIYNNKIVFNEKLIKL